MPFDVSRRAPDDLDEGPEGAEVSLLVRIEDADERDLGQVETLAQQVDPDHDVDLSAAQRREHLDPLHGVQLGVQVADLHAILAQVVGEVFGESLGQRGHQRTLSELSTSLHLSEEVVDLSLGRPHLDCRIDKAGGADDHLDGPLRPPHLVVAGRRRDVDHVPRALLPLLEAERPVVEGARQTEPVFDERRLARAVSAEHPVDLRHRDVRLVDEDQSVVGQEVHQRVGCLARLAAREMSRVVLDPRARPCLAQHLHVEVRPLAQALRLEQAPMVLEPFAPLLELRLDVGHRKPQLVRGRHVVRRRENRELLLRAEDLARDGVELLDALDLVAEELHAINPLLVGGDEVDHVAPHPETQASQVVVVALVQHLGELAQEDLAPDRLTFLHMQRLAHVVLDGANAVDAAHARDHQHVTPRQQVLRRGVAHAVDVVVAARVLFDVGVGPRDVGLGLVVVVVAHEVLDRVVGQQAAKLGAQLGRQRLVRAEDQDRPLKLLDRPCHHVGLAAAGHAEEDLLAQPRLDAFDQPRDRLRLVAGRLEGCVDTKGVGHRRSLILRRTNVRRPWLTVRSGSSPPRPIRP